MANNFFMDTFTTVDDHVLEIISNYEWNDWDGEHPLQYYLNQDDAELLGHATIIQRIADKLHLDSEALLTAIRKLHSGHCHFYERDSSTGEVRYLYALDENGNVILPEWACMELYCEALAYDTWDGNALDEYRKTTGKALPSPIVSGVVLNAKEYKELLEHAAEEAENVRGGEQHERR